MLDLGIGFLVVEDMVGVLNGDACADCIVFFAVKLLKYAWLTILFGVY
jgi:hypothetical protein